MNLCNGTQQQTINSSSCQFEMLSVTQAPLFLTQGDLIVARVRALNAVGWGNFSQANTVG